ncbi:MAG: tRNA (adenosine(37)-N6)-dimethylallyltransferase MiaA [Acholeplasmatales bacterium]|nr:tRNA (adenosine(37)-N6)-dimethylallyltransferase MiaA [Acholeplasmatales bacterium]MDD7394494.1 tRNA (adenosine(37)-N6)-dimethylallyltransferase MiaA [Acholeplasmatales bacterium]MDY4016809.1 tRNA (adenosine(37)-N6)-dimethylallyltransferase MiaA [Bacilli bacterium]HCX07880.1 tRNA (adenosine(37)-N6)-dimethylallyltransferase MiaA [Acholeplasmatales bacterium]
MKKVIVITGPTAVGKTKLSIEIAKRLQTDIINGDAYQIYQKMNIGTAKPTDDEKQGVIHHYMDFLDSSKTYSIAEFQKGVRECIDDLTSKNKVPLIVGGSGLYIDSVIKNYQFLEEKRSNEQSKYDSLTNEELHQVLANLDPDKASEIHPNNRKRVLRAIELISSNVDNTSRSKKNELVYDALIIFLNDNRESLYDRINKRVDKMLADGLIEEVKNIGINNYSMTSKVAIGYKEVIQYLNNEIDYNEMVELIKKNSRHYAKRQFTWFKNQDNCQVVNINLEDFNKTIDEVYNLITVFLSK